MTDAELSSVEAQSLIDISQFTNLNGSQNVIHVDLGIDVDIMAHMASMKMGYYNSGWDIDMTNYYLGSTDQTTPLKWNGIFMEFGFDNISNNTTRTLNYIDIGTPSANGTVTAAMNSVSALVSPGGNVPNGVLQRYTGLAGTNTTVTFNNEPVSFLFASKYSYNGANVTGIFNKIPNLTP